MAVVVSDLKARFGLDDKNFQSGMKRVDKQLGNTKTDIFSLEKAFKLAWAGISAAVVAGATKVGMESINMASDIQELDNVINKTFGDASDSVRAYADTYSKAVGRSKTQTRELTSFYGQMMKSTGLSTEENIRMSQSLTQLTYDMGSFKNISDERARFALKGIITGETESLKEQGIVMTQVNLENSKWVKQSGKMYAEMTALEKLQARYNFVLEQTAFFQNDATDTIKSTANQTKVFSSNMANLKTNLGFLLEPKYNKVLIQINELLGNFVDITDKAVSKMQNFGGEAAKLRQVFDFELGSDETFRRFDKFYQEYKDSLGEMDLNINIDEEYEKIRKLYFHGELTKEELSKGTTIEDKMDVLINDFFDTIVSASNKASGKITYTSGLLSEDDKTTDEQILASKELEDNNTAMRDLFNEMIDDYSEKIIEQEKNLKLDKQIADSDKEIQDFINQERLNNLNVAREIYNEFTGLTYDEAIQKYNELTSGMEASSLGLDEFTMALEGYLNSLDKSKDKTEELPDTLSSLSKGMSEVAQITSELSELFGDDFLGALTNTLNSASSLAMNIASGNVLGAVASGVSLANDINSYINASSGIEEKREEANKRFEDAVDKFEKTINDMNIGESIKYAQLTPPSQLASASVTGAGTEGANLDLNTLLSAGNTYIADLLGLGTKTNATIDTSAIQEQLNKAGYGDIDVASIFGKYAQYSEYRDLSDWGKKKSYISGYDIAGATEEINQIIEDMYQKNLVNFKTAVGLTADNFKNVMINTFSSGGEISKNLNEMMRDAAIKGFFSQEAFTKLNEMLGDKFSEALFKDLNMEDFNITSDMSLEDAMSTFANAYEIGSEQLTELFDKLGISVDNTTESMNRLSSSSTNLPSGVKTALANYQATNVTGGDTNIIIQGDMFGDNIQKKIIQGINAAKGTATGNYMPLY